MLKVTVKAPGEITYQDVPTPEPREGEALISVKSVGLCYSDIAPYKGNNLDVFPLPMVQGHEFGGIIEDIHGKSENFKPGMKVAIYPLTECGECYYCKKGMQLLCENQVMFGSSQKEGGMAEKIAVPLKSLVKLNDNFDISFAGIIEPATVAYRTIEGIKDSNIIIIGTGAIGLMMQQICKHNNNKVIAADIMDQSLDAAKELGVDLVVNINGNEKIIAVNKFLKNEKVDVVIINILTKENIQYAMDIVRKDGLIIYIGLPKKIEVDFSPILFKALKIKGSISYNIEHFKAASRLVQRGDIDYRRIVTRMFPMDHAKEAYEFKANTPSLKVILVNK
ncbi:MAG: alcohol dehydrogenase catalytic domain-containing protein [Clostridiales bacterium]|nr:alcohol dehydrogenase catalytic domain-containing protein [Clostridiales bacterium]